MTTPSGIPIRSLQYWGTVSGTVNQRGSTADVWQGIKDAAAANGLDAPGLSLGDFNRLRSAAVGVRNANEAFNRLAPADSLQAPQIAMAPWARSLAEQDALGKFQVRFLHTSTDAEGNESSAYKFTVFTGALPATKGDLLNVVDQAGQAMADEYETEFVGTSDITIFRV